MYGVYFPTLFPEAGWDYPLSRGETKRIAINNAKEDLAYSLAGILYDNEELPEPIRANRRNLSAYQLNTLGNRRYGEVNKT